MKSASITELEEVDDVGEIVAKNIYEFFRSSAFVEIEKLFSNGVKIIKNDYSDKPENTGFFTQKIVVITGVFQSMPRSKIVLLLERQGARVMSSLK